MIPDSFKQDLLNRVDVVELIERYVPLKKGGANHIACCPFHSEKTPSFTVSPTKQFYHCFGCGAHGNAISFLMEYQGMGYIEAIKDLAESVGMKVPETERGGAVKRVGPDLLEVMERASRYYREQLKTSPAAIDYLKARGLTGKIALRFGIGYAPSGWQSLRSVYTDYEGGTLKEAGLVIEAEGGRRYDRFRDRIMFPILNQRGSVIAFGGRVLGSGEPKYLNSPETPLFEKGRELYGLPQARDAIRASSRVIVVEGYMDVVALAQHGIEYAVATLGTATTPAHLQKLFRLTDQVVFCFDGDAAGRRAAWHALEVALPALTDTKAVRFMFLPMEHDPDSFVRSQGRETFEAAIADARPLSAFLLSELSARVDAGTAEGRSRLIAEAKPLLKKVAAPALQIQLLRQLADASNTPLEDVGRLTGIRAAPADAWRRAAAPQRAERARAPSTEQRLLQLLMVNPGLHTRIPMEFLDPHSPDAEALLSFFAFARQHAGKGAFEPRLIEQFKGGKFEQLFNRLQSQVLELKLLPEEAEAEMEEKLPQIEKQHVNREIDRLKASITDADAARLSELTARLWELSKRADSSSNMI